MKIKTSVLGFAATLALLSSSSTARATTIDFNGYSNDTLLIAGNPYPGGVILHGSTTAESVGLLATFEATIQNGEVQVMAPGLTQPVGMYRSVLTATFLEPVTSLSLRLGSFRGAGYTFTAVDDLGQSITRTGELTKGLVGPLATFYETVNLPIPPGYALNSLKIGSSDPKREDGAFWLDDLTFTARVPDSGSAASLLLLNCSALLSVRALGARRPQRRD